MRVSSLTVSLVDPDGLIAPDGLVDPDGLVAAVKDDERPVH